MIPFIRTLRRLIQRDRTGCHGNRKQWSLTHFNRARSHNKLYDITRCGAAGIYSDVDIYREHVQDGINGIFCSEDENDWVEAICELLTEPAKRAAIYRRALAECEELASGPGFRLNDQAMPAEMAGREATLWRRIE